MKPKASQKLDFGRSLGSALFLEVTASIRDWSAGLIPEQRPVKVPTREKASPVGIAKTIVGWLLCWGVGIVCCLFNLLYYVIWWLLPLETPRNYISSVTMYTGFPITLKKSSSRKQFRKYLVRFWTENTTATKKLKGRRERGNRVTGLIFSKTHPFITQNRPN